MKNKKILLLTLLLASTLIITACAKDKGEVPSDLPPMVMVDGQLYVDTGYVNSNITWDSPDGKIESTVKGSEDPKKDNESNFGKGYEYKKGKPSRINVKIDGRWFIFRSIAISYDGPTEDVAHFVGVIVETREDELIVEIRSIPEEFQYIFKNQEDKLVSLSIENLNHSLDGKTITTEGLPSNIVEVSFDGSLVDKDADILELGQIYDIQVRNLY
ncbi:MAG: hypothetical protein GX219_06790 [Tissierellia bacterium]|nr:hypothetical protein [Tissierellia bacterium]